MFIELTDHLRCPADHDEAFLVLLPDQVEGRSVRSGTLGCPVCDRRFTLHDGVLDTGRRAAAGRRPPSPARLTPDALAPLAGSSGPGGYLVLVGPPAAGVARRGGAGCPAWRWWRSTRRAEVVDEAGISVLRGGRAGAQVALDARVWCWGRPTAAIRRGCEEAARVVLPGLRVVGEGPDPRSGDGST